MSALEKIIRPARIGEPFDARVQAPVQPALPPLTVPEISWTGGADTSVTGPPSISSTTAKFTWSEDKNQHKDNPLTVHNPTRSDETLKVPRIQTMVMDRGVKGAQGSIKIAALSSDFSNIKEVTPTKDVAPFDIFQRPTNIHWGTGPHSGSELTYDIQMHFDVGISGSDIIGLGTLWFVLGAWADGTTPGVDPPIMSSTHVLAMSDFGFHLPEVSFDLTLSGIHATGTSGGFNTMFPVLAVWSDDWGATNTSNNVFHANFTATESDGKTASSPISPNIGVDNGGGSVTDGDLGFLGGSIPGDTHAFTLQLCSIGVSFDDTPPNVPFGSVGEASNLVGTDVGPP